MYKFHLAHLGEALSEATVLNWKIAVGQRVKKDQSLLEVESDKSVVDIPSPVTGTLTTQCKKAGENVHVGDALAMFDVANEENTSTTEPATTNASPVAETIPALPSARLKARMAHLSLATIQKETNHRIVTLEDVNHYIIKHQKDDTAMDNKNETVEGTENKTTPSLQTLTNIQKSAIQHLNNDEHHLASVTLYAHALVDKLVKVHDHNNTVANEHHAHLTYTTYFVKALALLVKQYPILNTSYDEAKEALIEHHDINIGIVTNTKEGLYIPVIHHADEKSLIAIANEITQLHHKAQQHQLSVSDMTGASLSLTNLGAQEADYFTPIINWPEVAMMGIGTITESVYAKEGGTRCRSITSSIF